LKKDGHRRAWVALLISRVRDMLLDLASRTHFFLGSSWRSMDILPLCPMPIPSRKKRNKTENEQAPVRPHIDKFTKTGTKRSTLHELLTYVTSVYYFTDVNLRWFPVLTKQCFSEIVRLKQSFISCTSMPLLILRWTIWRYASKSSIRCPMRNFFRGKKGNNLHTATRATCPEPWTQYASVAHSLWSPVPIQLESAAFKVSRC
jgi:hypothetical protein